MAQDPLPPLLSHHFREKNGERGKMRRTDEWNRRTYQTSEAIATHTNVQRSRRQGSEGWSEGGGGGKAPGKWVRPVCHPRHSHTVCSPLRGTQTVQHAAERRDDRRRGRRRRGEAKGKKKMWWSRRLQMDRGVGKKEGHMCWLWSERVGSHKNICSRLSLMVSSHADGSRFICCDFKEAVSNILATKQRQRVLLLFFGFGEKSLRYVVTEDISKSTAASLYSVMLWHHLADSLPVR